MAGCAALALCLLQGGAVAAAQSDAAEAGAAVLAAGGNAVDAAAATAFALAVTYPMAGNLGGGGFLLYRAPDGEAFFLDFREAAPAAAHPGLYLQDDGRADRTGALRGWKAVAVPGSVPGLLSAHRRWGRLTREQVLAPAIRLAEEGFELAGLQYARLRRHTRALHADALARRTFFHADGTPLVPGDVVVQPELAATLRALSREGEAVFRAGPVVDALLEAAAAGGGILAAEDFRDYRPVLRPAHRFSWRGLELLAGPPPSSGGVFLEQVLVPLEGRALRTYRNPRTVQLLGEATARAFADRNRWLGDPAGFDFDLAALTDPAVLRARGLGLRGNRYTPPARLGSAMAPPESGDTTHLSVVDDAGGACALTTTLNSAFGAKVMAPGGFFMNNEMDDFAAAPGKPNQFGLLQGRYNAVVAGRRPLSSMCPLIVLRDGKVDAVLGSPGGPTILTSVLQVFLNRYAFAMAPEQAVAAPRFHRQDVPPDIQWEPGRIDAAGMAWLRSLGQPLRRRNRIGNVCAVFRRSDGSWAAVADSRREGRGVVVEPLPSGR